MSRWLRCAMGALAALLAGGCVSVGIGAADSPGLTYYVLDDARPAPARAPAASPETLALRSVGADPLTDSTAMIYSRRAGERALYQLAAWNERPTRRFLQLAEQRLEARGAFAAVTQLGQPLPSEWLLTLTIEQMFHDVSAAPGRAQLVVRAELIDRREGQRGQAATARFQAAPAVTEPNAAMASRAFAEAAAEVLDQLVAWLEATTEARKRR